MKLLAVILLMGCAQAWAQPDLLEGAEMVIQPGITDPAAMTSEVEDEWLAFTVPALAGTAAPCCWTNQWRGVADAGCSLDSRMGNQGSHEDSPLTDTLVLYAHVEAGQVDDLRVTGEQCPMDGSGQKVNWLPAITERNGLDWLEQVARTDSKQRVNHGALWALALHRGPQAGEILTQMAGDKNESLGEQAIFWLGEARGQQGFLALEELLTTLPKGERRRHLNFALSVSDTRQAVELLADIARDDPDPHQRTDALFWLAQEHPAVAEPLLLDVLDSERNSEVIEETVFAISQLPEDRAGPLLLALARDSGRSNQIRRQAFFWLTQSEDQATLDELVSLLSR